MQVASRSISCCPKVSGARISGISGNWMLLLQKIIRIFNCDARNFLSDCLASGISSGS